MERKTPDKKKRYFSAEDYLNLFYIILLSIFIVQITIRFLTYNAVIFKLMNIISGALFVIAILSAIKGYTVLRNKDKEMNRELAVQVLERYVREHKNGRKEEERDLVNAITVILTESENTVILTESENKEEI